MSLFRRRIRPDLFETRTDAWYSAGLGDELEPEVRSSRGGLLAALLIIPAVLFDCARRAALGSGYETWSQISTVVVLVVAGSAAATWLGSWLSPRFYRRVDPAVAGTVGFLVRLVALGVVVITALRIA